jgi:primosomal protein N' (replication factor Y)
VIAAILSATPSAFMTRRRAPGGRRAAALRASRRADRQRNERDQAEAHARALALAAEPPPGVTVLGPAEAPLALIRGRYRIRLLVKTEREVDLQGFLRDWLARAPKPAGNVRVAVDVDPQSFL